MTVSLHEISVPQSKLFAIFTCHFHTYPVVISHEDRLKNYYFSFSILPKKCGGLGGRDSVSKENEAEAAALPLAALFPYLAWGKRTDLQGNIIYHKLR